MNNLEENYLKSLKSTYTELAHCFKAYEYDFKFDLNQNTISEAIVIRLKTYYETQEKIKSLLNKRYAAAAADFFVEQILFFLHLYIQSKDKKIEVHSERQIKAKRNSIRPDISIWDGDQVLAIIECKTQLGWNRDGWEEQFTQRESILQKSFPKAKSYLLVMTGSNWGGFGQNPKLNKQYFCLLEEIWPENYCNASQIFTPIERLFKQLI